MGDPLFQSLSQMSKFCPSLSVCAIYLELKYASWWFQSIGRVLVKLDHVTRQMALKIEDPFFNQPPTLVIDFWM